MRLKIGEMGLAEVTQHITRSLTSRRSKGLDTKAVLLDRDGIISELVYSHQHGINGSPFTPKQLRLTPFA